MHFNLFYQLKKATSQFSYFQNKKFSIFFHQNFLLFKQINLIKAEILGILEMSKILALIRLTYVSNEVIIDFFQNYLAFVSRKQETHILVLPSKSYRMTVAIYKIYKVRRRGRNIHLQFRDINRILGDKKKFKNQYIKQNGVLLLAIAPIGPIFLQIAFIALNKICKMTI